MNAFKTNSRKIICHRGYKATHLENTREALAEGADKGFTFLETDLRATNDGHIVLTHDPDFVRMGGSTKLVHEYSRKELESFRHRNGQSLLFLDDHLKEFESLNWVFDIKPQSSTLVVDILLSWMKVDSFRQWMNQHVKMLCWNPMDELRLSSMLPDVTFFAIKNECIRVGVCHLAHVMFLGGVKAGRTYSVTESFKGQNLFSKRFVNEMHQRRAFALAFLPDSKNAFEKAEAVGFDEILTDLPKNELV